MPQADAALPIPFVADLVQQVESEPDRASFWLDSPANLYMTDDQARGYLRMMARQSYAEPFHAPIRELLTSYADLLTPDGAKKVTFVDLGPGYPDKSFSLIRRLSEAGTLQRYVAVDINQYFLDIAVDSIRSMGVTAVGLRTHFSDLKTILDHQYRCGRDEARLFVLGLTFLNFRPRRILPILTRLVRRDDVLLVATQVADGLSPTQMIEPYLGPAVEQFAVAPLMFLGFDASALEYEVRFNRIRIEVGFRLRRTTCTITGHRFSSGTRLVTAISYRYPSRTLLAMMRRYFGEVSEVSDSGSTVLVLRSSDGRANR